MGINRQPGRLGHLYHWLLRRPGPIEINDNSAHIKITLRRRRYTAEHEATYGGLTHGILGKFRYISQCSCSCPSGQPSWLRGATRHFRSTFTRWAFRGSYHCSKNRSPSLLGGLLQPEKDKPTRSVIYLLNFVFPPAMETIVRRLLDALSEPPVFVYPD